jgi:aminoglycoside phosphotransferase (APT) family kinase protein
MLPEDHLAHLRSSPSAKGLSAMATALERGSRVASVRRLGGGLGSATSVVELCTRSGAQRRVVLKRYRVGDDIALEWERLGFARDIAVPSPEPLALDVAGEWFGSPSIVISLLPGRPLLLPRNLDAWLHQIADTLVAIQAFDVSHAAGALLVRHGSQAWTRPDSTGWGSLYERAIDAVERSLPRAGEPDVLCHGDFHPGNLLFARAKLSGVVDWSSTRLGPRSFELAYCRTEVGLLFGGDVPDGLARAYRSASGSSTDDLPLWDLMCALVARRWSHMWLTAYREQGRTDLTLARFRARLRAFTQRALSRM